MPDDARPARRSLSLEDVAELLPGTGELMASVANTWWRCAYAGRGGSWDLAAYYARRARGLLRKLAVVRPKYADDVAGFESERIAPVLAACEREDRAAFDDGIDAAVRRANELHVKWAKAYIRWRLPDEPPRDLKLTP